MSLPKHQRVSGLSGNEIFCLNKVGMRPGQLCVGNSVVAIGVARGLGAGLSTLGGGEVREITQMVHDGRAKAFNRMLEEAKIYKGVGLTGVSFDVINHGGNMEFLAIGSTVHGEDENDNLKFSSFSDAQQLYCQLDAGFEPRSFVFGNVAYSIGVGGNIAGAFKSLARGEVSNFTEIFDKTRHAALHRIQSEAKRVGANSVIGIRTTISSILGAQEMIMVGTAASHPSLEMYRDNPVTCDMTNEEMWNMVNIGYLPLQLVMGVSVYSLGFAGGVMAFLQSLGGGEVAGLTEILYEAREKALARIEREAERIGADEVVGVKTRVYELGGGLVEFMAIGTAVKKFPGTSTKNSQLPPQAIIQDQDTFVEALMGQGRSDLSKSSMASANATQRGPLAIVIFVFVILFYIFRILSRT